MKKIRFYSAILPAMFLLPLTSCLKHEGGNFQTFVHEPVVIGPDVTGISEPMGSSVVPGLTRFLIPGLAGKVNPGDCLLLSFKVDFDNQPNPSYYTATEARSIALPSPIPVEVADTSVVEGYDTPIVDAAVCTSNYGSKALIDNLLFFLMLQEENKTYRYKVACQRIPSNWPSGSLPSLYVSAKLDGNDPANTVDDNTYARVFDLSGLKSYLSSDLNLNGTRSIKIYCRVENDNEGKAVFREFDSIDIKLDD
jgi:hypothetical protein